MPEGCKLSERVMDTVAWLDTHQRHGEIQERLNEHQPPAGTYEIWTYTCLTCKASHVVSKKSGKEVLGNHG